MTSHDRACFIVYFTVMHYMDHSGDSRANTCAQPDSVDGSFDLESNSSFSELESNQSSSFVSNWNQIRTRLWSGIQIRLRLLTWNQICLRLLINSSSSFIDSYLIEFVFVFLIRLFVLPGQYLIPQSTLAFEGFLLGFQQNYLLACLQGSEPAHGRPRPALAIKCDDQG